MTHVTEWRARVLIALLGATTSCMGPAPVFGQTTGGWLAAPTAQANGARMQTPLNSPVSRWSKLSLTVDTRWANNFGYRPIEVTITSPKPTAADHVVTIRLHSGWSSSLNVEQDIELPSGSTSATTTIAVPQYQSAGQFFWWDVWVDGTKDKDLSISVIDMANRFGSNFGSPAGLSILAVRPAVASQRTLMLPSTFEFEVFSLWISEFPVRWIDYTCFDVVALSWRELQLLSQTAPAAFKAIERWLRAGGQLWVDQVGNEFEKLEELSKLFQLRSSIAPAVRRGAYEEAEVSADDDAADNGWQPVRFRRGIREGQVVTFLDITTGGSRVVRDAEAIARLQSDPNFVVTDQRFEPAEDDAVERRWPQESSAWFVEQRLGLGCVRAFRESSEVALLSQRPQASNPSASANEDTAERMPRSLTTALRSTDRWSTRHGMAPDDVNRDFVNLLVPGVGLAPVTEFQVLITLFVVLIGPVNFWLLKRWRRLHLLVLTVPLAAALVTVALFAYATVSDGFQTKVRVRSLTTLNQRSGEAACWAWLSYYAGLAPANGLTMPSDIVIYPIHPTWNANRGDLNFSIARDMVWKGNETNLTHGWLRSRTPTQYLTIRSRKTPRRLELAAGGGKLRVTNKLETAIDFVLVVDRAKKFWVGDNLASGEVAFLKHIGRRDAIRRIRELVMENEAEPPVALSGNESHYAVMQRRQWRGYGGRFGYQSGEARLATNLMSETVADLAGLAGQPALALPPQSYVAVTETGPEVELGMRGAEEEASFHVIVGQW